MKCDGGRGDERDAPVGLDGIKEQSRTGCKRYTRDSRNHLQPKNEERHDCLRNGGGVEGIYSCDRDE